MSLKTLTFLMGTIIVTEYKRKKRYSYVIVYRAQGILNFFFFKPEAHGPQRSPECTAMKVIFNQNTVNVACKKKLPFVCHGK